MKFPRASKRKENQAMHHPRSLVWLVLVGAFGLHGALGEPTKSPEDKSGGPTPPASEEKLPSLPLPPSQAPLLPLPLKPMHAPTGPRFLPGEPRSLAVRSSRDCRALRESCGCCCRARAALPLTKAAASEVPDETNTRPPGLVLRISTPGAARSTKSPCVAEE